MAPLTSLSRKDYINVTSTICPGLSSGCFFGGSGSPSMSPKSLRASVDMGCKGKWTQLNNDSMIILYLVPFNYSNEYLVTL